MQICGTTAQESSVADGDVAGSRNVPRIQEDREEQERERLRQEELMREQAERDRQEAERERLRQEELIREQAEREARERAANEQEEAEDMHHWTIKQSEVQDFVSKLNEIVVQEAVHNFKYIPRDFQLDPPEGLQRAEVGDYTVPVMFSVIRDVEGEALPKITNERFVYRVTVEDVNECEDETLPKDWKHE